MAFPLVYVRILSIILVIYAAECLNIPKIDSSMRPSGEIAYDSQTDTREYIADQDLNITHNFTNFSRFVEFEENQKFSGIKAAEAAAKKTANGNLINLLPSRITEKLLKHFFSLFFSDPDILKSCAKVGSWVLWSFISLSLLGMK